MKISRRQRALAAAFHFAGLRRIDSAQSAADCAQRLPRAKRVRREGLRRHVLVQSRRLPRARAAGRRTALQKMLYKKKSAAGG